MLFIERKDQKIELANHEVNIRSKKHLKLPHSNAVQRLTVVWNLLAVEELH